VAVADNAAPFDIEIGLRKLAQFRQRRDVPARGVVELGDRLARYVGEQFGSEAVETAGLAMVHAGSAIGALANLGLQPETVVNVLLLGGQRLIVDARAADGEVSGG
jgi:hypothetical protein